MGNISKIRIQNTDYTIKDSRVDNKVEKVSSTDNAIVRFDGTSGNIQNSGVTIDDSNHLTATKLITIGGTSSQFVKGDGSLDSNTYAGAQTSGGAANKAVSIPLGQVDSTSTSTAFTATVDGITELRDGVCVYLKNGVVTSAANCTLDVNGLGAKPMYNTMAATTAISTQWNVSYTMLFIYNSTRVSGGCWDMYYGYNSDNNTIGFLLRTSYHTLPASDTSRYYKIFFTSADNTKWVPASVDSTNNATSARPVNQRPINPFGAIVYAYSTTNFTAGTNVTASVLWQQYPLTLGYSFNRTGAALTLTTSKPVFIKCAPQDDGSAIIDADVPYVQDLPTTEDGKIYIFLGVAYSATQIEMQMVHPVYHYKNGSINLWTGTGAQTDVSKSTESNVIDVGEYDLMKINEVKGKSLVMNQLVTNGNFANTDNWIAYGNNGTISASDNVLTYTFTNVVDNPYSNTVRHTMPTSIVGHVYLVKYDIYVPKRSQVNVRYYHTGTYSIEVEEGWHHLSSIASATAAYSYAYFGVNGASTYNYSVGDSYKIKNVNIVDLTQMFGAGNEPTTVEEVEAILGNGYNEYNTGEVVGNNVEKLDVYDSNDTKKGSLALNLTELTGKVNGEGTSVTIYPDGLHGVGTAYDSLIVDEDGYARKAVKRIGSVDLGDYNWVASSSRFNTNTTLSNAPSSTSVDCLNDNYKADAGASNRTVDKSICIANGGYVYVYDTSYSDATTFKTAMSGVKLVYALKTPIEYVLDTPVQCVAKVYPNGTVKQVPVMPDSTPMVLDVTYLRDNSLYAIKEYVNDAIADKADAATTLAGYGITDAKIESGVITLGSNSITPLKKLSGTTAERPTNVSVGDCYFDTDLGKDIYVKEVNNNVVTWVDSNGFSAVPTIGTTDNRPDLFEDYDRGFEYFDTNLKTQVYLDYEHEVIVNHTYQYSQTKSAYYSNPFLEGDELYVHTVKNTSGTNTLTLAFCKTNDGTFEDAIYLDASVVISDTSVDTPIVRAPDPIVYPYIYNAYTQDSNHTIKWIRRNIEWIPSQTTDNLVTSVSSSSTDDQYPSAKCVYDLVGNIETLLASI